MGLQYVFFWTKVDIGFKQKNLNFCDFFLNNQKQPKLTEYNQKLPKTQKKIRPITTDQPNDYQKGSTNQKRQKTTITTKNN